MSKFEVYVESISEVLDHPNADRLSLVKIRGYHCVSGKLEDGSHRYKVGDVVVYVPEDSIVPEYLLRQGFWNEKTNTGFLAGPNGDRVKAVLLRGYLSQGIIFPVQSEPSNTGAIGFFVENDRSETKLVRIGEDVSEFLGITKWEPEIPAELLGDVIGIPSRYAVKYDFDNLLKFPTAFDQLDTDVVVTEKLHGILCEIGTINELAYEAFYKGDTYVASKGLASKTLVMQYTEKNLLDNVYVKTAMSGPLSLAERVRNWAYSIEHAETAVVIGEIVGVQDLKYGLTEPTFFGFDIHVKYTAASGLPDRYLGDAEKDAVFFTLDIPRVPVLYRGKWDRKVVDDLASGKTTVNDGVNIREGVVITPVEERTFANGRLILKHISQDYLVRKNGTEYQ